MQRYQPNNAKSKPVTLDDAHDVAGCIALLKLMRDMRRRGERWYFFRPGTAAAGLVHDLWRCGRLHLQMGNPTWRAELLEMPA